mmetsp:Transcript_8340/g.19033  ORF Transcript_8340/g.19033 Transcript_8340/m.19033 type:complete len:171 (+) Transcript_8340:137-649(+)
MWWRVSGLSNSSLSTGLGRGFVSLWRRSSSSSASSASSSSASASSSSASASSAASASAASAPKSPPSTPVPPRPSGEKPKLQKHWSEQQKKETLATYYNVPVEQIKRAGQPDANQKHVLIGVSIGFALAAAPFAFKSFRDNEQRVARMRDDSLDDKDAARASRLSAKNAK